MTQALTEAARSFSLALAEVARVQGMRLVTVQVPPKHWFHIGPQGPFYLATGNGVAKVELSMEDTDEYVVFFE